MPRKKKEPKHKGVFKSPSGSGDYSVRFTDLDKKRPAFVVGPYDQAVHVYELHSQAARAGLEVAHDAGKGGEVLDDCRGSDHMVPGQSQISG
jgi:hypothetical protein